MKSGEHKWSLQEKLSVLLSWLTQHSLVILVQLVLVVIAAAQGLMHGDLFRDNVLFQDGQITGLIDFDHTARGPLLFDLAVVALDWVYLAGGGDAELAALANGYATVRPLEEGEREAWGTASTPL